MPEGGLHDLQKMVLRDLPWAEGLPPTLLDKETHRRQVVGSGGNDFMQVVGFVLVGL